MGVSTIIMGATAAAQNWKTPNPGVDDGPEYSNAVYDPEWGSTATRTPFVMKTTSRGGDRPKGSGGGVGSTSGTATRVQYSYSPSYGATRFGEVEGHVTTGGKMHTSPERLRRDNSSHSLLDRVPEDGAIEFEHEANVPEYAGTAADDEEEDEDWEAEVELELEEQGLYYGSYTRLMATYTLVPITFILTFVFLAFLPRIAYPIHASPSTYPYAPYLRFPIPEILASSALWSIGHLLRDPLYSFSLILSLPFPSLSPSLPIIISTTLHTLFSTLLRMLALPLLLVPHHMIFPQPTWHDPTFRRVWWAALGWAAAEGIVGVKQGYEGIGFYRDVLVSLRKGPYTSIGKGRDVETSKVEIAAPPAGHAGQETEVGTRSARSTSGSPHTITTAAGGSSTGAGRVNSLQVDTRSIEAGEGLYGLANDEDVGGEREFLLQDRTTGTMEEPQQDNAILMQIDRDLERLMALKGREELEEVYGMPVIRIPVFLSCLQRFNSVLLSLGLTLLLASAYIHSSISISHLNPDTPIIHPPIPPHSYSDGIAYPATPAAPVYLYASSIPTHVYANLLSPSTTDTRSILSAIQMNQDPNSPIRVEDTPTTSNTPLHITLPIVIFVHLFLAILYTPVILPRIGIHTAAYVGLLISLGSFFAGLGVWEALS